MRKPFILLISLVIILSFNIIEVLGLDSVNENALSIASFNIQVFGKTKAKKKDVLLMLAKIISIFDVVAIQEIRDSSNSAIQKSGGEPLLLDSGIVIRQVRSPESIVSKKRSLEFIGWHVAER